ncbi:MAG TPA: ABC transporter ATP-binding protein [Oscillospiraceae bacterium]|nr:ABC transporter ATP-binding protein [Oscillospiraceae bacterium]HNW05069.1 ABC transporter ATP-binding protein [Oscillospiraceae bacterium]
MDTEYAVSMRNITKTFGPVLANEKVSLDIRRGEILSLLGENGSGKTTLMNMLSGIYYPDSGKIFVNGEEVAIRSPKDALRYGIGMVHQHFRLVNVFTAAENIVLGLRSKGNLNLQTVAKNIQEICDKYGFEIDPNKKIYDMSVSEKQTVEIVKVLYRGADILILDEPTAVLTPQETERLFGVMRNMKADGKAVVIITHKLAEVLAVSDRVSVLRRGKNVGTLQTAGTNMQELTERMVGHKIELNIHRSERKELTKRLSIRNLSCADMNGIPKLCNVSMDVFGGEILGIAGISGCGQKELLEGVAGLQRVTGSIMYTAPGAKEPVEIVGKSPLEIMRSGIALSFVPEDRLGMGLVGNMDLTDNMMIRSYLNGNSPLLDRKSPKDLAKRVVSELDVVTPGLSTPVRQLSGGNVQKVLVGREISSSPAVLMSAYAVRGLDINTSYTIYNLMNDQKEKGVAVIYVGEDLDVLLELCDRIAVLCAGHLNKIFEAAETTKDEVGFYMTCLNPDAAGKEDKTI